MNSLNFFQEIMSENMIDVIKLMFAIIGGFFALRQWNTQIKHKRAEIVKELITKVRDDNDISSIMDVIDWDEGIRYNGKFSVNPNYPKESLKKISDDELFRKIDKTLSHYSYICYLKANKTLTKKELSVFEYKLRRIADNEHTSNYLYSLYHWSKRLNVECSFCYLIQYFLDQGYFTKDFKDLHSSKYTCYLKLPATRTDCR